ncbi:YvcK family protein [Candidatus Kaiserbacteria bacterium]|nr:YvcK family protein [Candidatus Kaiserbacteria bacterium]
MDVKKEPKISPVRQKKRVVVIGGGTGTHTVLRGLQHHHNQLDITAIVSMADSGGSTGRLRDAFGSLPVGDVRMALTALASDDDHTEIVRQLFLYRFNKDAGLNGHNFGNLFLTALTDIVGSEAEATRVASKILRTRGQVIPVTTDNVNLVAEYDDNTTLEGEHYIDEPPAHFAHRKINALYTNPKAIISDEAFNAIIEADCIVLGPGDLYSSLLANCVVQGVPEAFAQSKAQVVYVANLMTRPGQTRGMSIGDHLREIERYIGIYPDVLLKNNTELPKAMIDHYKSEGDEPLLDDSHLLPIPTITRDLLSHLDYSKADSDTLTRSLVRHDSDKLANAIMALLPDVIFHSV